MSKKIVIVGGGVAGLTAGIYAQKNGFESMIVEKNHFAGGNLTGWKRKNCYIDNCVHWLCGSKNGNYLNKLWKEIGAFDNLQLHQSEDFLVSEYNFQTVSLNKDVDKTREKMLEVSPDDEKQIEKFIKSTKLITELANKKLFGQLKNYITLFAMYQNKTIKEVASEFKHP